MVKMKNISKLIMISVFVAGLTVLPSIHAQAKEMPRVHWRFQSAYSPGDYNSEVYSKALIKYVKEHTGGKFTITRFYAGEIMPSKEMLIGIGAGLAEIGEGSGAYWGGVEPALELSLGLPFTNRAPIGDTWAFQNASKWSALVSKIFEENGCHYVGWHDYGPLPLFYSNVPIRKLEDWKGVKVRVSGYKGKLLKELGAATVYIPGKEIAHALSVGTIDVATWTAEAMKDMGFGALIDYFIMPPLMDHAGGILFVNKKAWNKLPEEYKKVIKEAELQLHYDSYLFWRKVMSDNINLAKGVGKGMYGYEVIRLPAKDVAEMKRISEDKIWNGWAKKSPRCAEALKLLKEWYSTYQN